MRIIFLLYIISIIAAMLKRGSENFNKIGFSSTGTQILAKEPAFRIRTHYRQPRNRQHNPSNVQIKPENARK